MSISKQELHEKAIEAIDPIIKDEQKLLRGSIKNIAFYSTLITVGAYIIMYAYKSSYYTAFNLPISCIKISLVDYLPLLFQLSILLLHILWYFVIGKIEKQFWGNTKRLNIFRALCGMIIFYYMLSFNGFYQTIPAWLAFFISFILGIGLEIIIVKTTMTKQYEGTVVESERSIEFARIIRKELFRRYLVNTGLIILFALVVCSTFLGAIKARTQTRYQTCIYHERQYVVVVDYGDSVIIQEAETDHNKLTVNTDSYIFETKEGLELSYVNYESTVLLNIRA